MCFISYYQVNFVLKPASGHPWWNKITVTTVMIPWRKYINMNACFFFVWTVMCDVWCASAPLTGGWRPVWTRSCLPPQSWRRGSGTASIWPNWATSSPRGPSPSRRSTTASRRVTRWKHVLWFSQIESSHHSQAVWMRSDPAVWCLSLTTV